MERERFLMELEFVQCLANPLYLNCKCFFFFTFFFSIKFFKLLSSMLECTKINILILVNTTRPRAARAPE